MIARLFGKTNVMRHGRLFALLLAGSLFAGGPASAFIASNGLQVVPEDNETFVVPFRGLSGDTDFWCAAGEYVNNFLRLPGATRIYRLTPPPRPRGAAIRFSLNPEGASDRTGLSTFGGTGPSNSVSASMARALCPPRFFIPGLMGSF
jgi:hypothetical protein